MKGCERLAIEARFLRYVKPLPNGCLLWTGGQSSGGAGRGKDRGRGRGGPYGSFKVNAQWGARRAHIVWAWLRGVLPEPRLPPGFQLDHECETGTLCVCCTGLKTEAENRALSRTRKINRELRTKARQIVTAERIARLERKREAALEKRSSRYG